MAGNKKIESQFRMEPKTFISGKALFYAAYVIGLLLIGLAAMQINPLLIIGGVVGIVGLVVIIQYPIVGFIAYLLVYFIRPGERFEALAALRLELLLGILLLFLLAIGDAVRGRGYQFPKDKVTISLLFFIAALGVSFIFSEWRMQSYEVVFAFIKTFILYYFVVKMADTEKLFYLIYWIIILGICLNGFESIVNYFGGNAHFNQGVMRAGGTTSFGNHPNSMAMYMATTIPMLMYLFSRHKTMMARLFIVSLMGLCLFCLLITGSRSGVITIVGIAITFAWFSRHRLVYYAAMVVLAVGIWIALPEQYKNRYGSITEQEIDAYSQGRLDAWQAGLGRFMEKPVYGVGPGAFAAAYRERDGVWLYSHSLYIETISSTGLLGFVTWWFFMYQFLKMLGDMKRRRGSPDYLKNQIGVFVRSNYAIIAGLLLAGVFGHILFRDTFYMLAAVIVAAGHSLLHETESRTEEG